VYPPPLPQDWFDDPLHNKESGENRVATVLLYLGEVLEGGETSLPIGIPIDEERQKMVNPSEGSGDGRCMCMKFK
jgi:hypothetical protein